MKEIIKKILPSFLINWYHFLLSFLGAFYYRFPSRKIKVIGITGTNGKSTVVHLATRVLESAGYKVASLSSIKFKIREKEWPNTLKMTMPGRFFIQKFLREAVKNNCSHFVLEVTSEGIKQHRHRFINFEAAVFTNLSPEHIEAHGGFENYRLAKTKLFQATKKIHILNIEDENVDYFLKFPAQKKYTCGLDRGDINNKNLNLKLQLIGEFNIYNALSAIAIGLSQGVDLGICRKAVEQEKGIAGRMEEVASQPFKVFVDYAFTPNALEKVYQTISNQQLVSGSRLICVLGACGGGRDKWKRPVLGQIAARYCHEIIITNEDPYDEDPMEIIEQVAKGSQSINSNQLELLVQKILDRREAIKKSLELAKPNDVVMITGKGCEPWICQAKGKKMAWDDRQVVKEELEKLK